MDRKFSSTSAIPLGGAESDVAWDEMLLVGEVARARGTAGEVYVNSTTDFPETRFATGATLWGRAAAGGRIERLTVERFRSHLGRPILTFSGVADMTAADRFAGWQLRVPVSDLTKLPEHVYHHHQLVGCAVETGDGTPVGTVSRVEGDGQARLVIDAAGGEVLVPLVQAFCVVDLVARRIVVTPPEGLLDANGEWRTSR